MIGLPTMWLTYRRWSCATLEMDRDCLEDFLRFCNIQQWPQIQFGI